MTFLWEKQCWRVDGTARSVAESMRRRLKPRITVHVVAQSRKLLDIKGTVDHWRTFNFLGGDGVGFKKKLPVL